MPNDPHTEHVNALCQSGDWATLLRYWVAHGLNPRAAIEDAQSILREKVTEDSRWASVGVFVDQFASNPTGLRNPVSEPLPSVISQSEIATLKVAELFRVMVVCKMSEAQEHLSLENRTQALTIGIEASTMVQEVARALGDDALRGFAAELRACGLREIGNVEAACQAYEEALATFRELASERPEVYRPQVVSALTELGALTHTLDHLEAARQAYEEALATLRELASERPEVYRPHLALTLNRLATVLLSLKMLRAARRASEEALAIFRELSGERPEVCRPHVASNLTELGMVLYALDHPKAARQAYEEALATFRELASERPEVYRPRVAGTLNGLGMVLKSLNRPEAARQACEEAQAIRRELPDSRPHINFERGMSLEQRENETLRSEHGVEASAKIDQVDATAFAPRKLRQYTPELLRLTLHRPEDRSRVVQTAKEADPVTCSVPTQPLGEMKHGTLVSVVLDVLGASAESVRMDAVWAGKPVHFAFPITPADAIQVVVTLRILLEGAQIGAIAFTRPVVPPKTVSEPRPAKMEKLRPVNSVFLSYSSVDRETVASLATAYKFAQIRCFFDRISLQPGEEWSSRLLREIDQSELFHLCWSKSAAVSEWVEKETLHAMKRRRRSFHKRPDITIQMLDGPPWAPHPPSLDALNFDDFARAAIVGYQHEKAG